MAKRIPQKKALSRILIPLIKERKKDVNLVRRFSKGQKMTLPESARMAEILAEDDPSTFRRHFGLPRPKKSK